MLPALEPVLDTRGGGGRIAPVLIREALAHVAEARDQPIQRRRVVPD
jgi:hypothetical protein